MRSWFIFSALLLGWVACQTPYYDDVGDAYIRGRLFLQTDPYGIEEALPVAAGKTVTLAYDTSTTDSLNYLFSTKTNADGYFNFTSLREGAEYVLRYQEALGGRKYFGDTVAQGGNDTLVLYASLARRSQTGLIITSLDTSGKLLGGVRHCLFASESIANGSDDKCTGSLRQFTGETNGYASTFGLPATTYWLRSSLELPKDKRVRVQQITVPPQQITEVRVELTPNVTAPINSLTIQVTDPDKAPLAGARACLFTSRTLAARDTCAGSNYQLVTNATGRADTSALLQGKYFVYAELFLDELHWKTRDSITIDTGSFKVQLILQPD